MAISIRDLDDTPIPTQVGLSQLPDPTMTQAMASQATAQAAPAPVAAPAPMPTIYPPQTQPKPFVLSPIRQQREQGLENSLQRLETPKPSPTGFWGKTGRILSDVGNAAGEVILGDRNMQDIPGTNSYKMATIRNTGNELAGLQKQDLAEENSARLADIASKQAAAAGLIEITPAMATELGEPSLAGQHVTQGALQHLYTTASTNKTKTNTASLFVQSNKFMGPNKEPVVIDRNTGDMGYWGPDNTLVSDNLQLIPSSEKMAQSNDYTGPKGEPAYFDPYAGNYYYVDASGQKQTQGIQRYVNPNAGAVTLVVPGANGSTLLRAKPGETIPNAAETPNQFGQRTPIFDKAYIDPANTTEKSYEMMDSAYNDYEAARNAGKSLPTGAQSMLALSTHLTTTFGNVKGARITRDMIAHHLGARSISDDALVAVQKLTNGDVLSPAQWTAFHDLISQSRTDSWGMAVREAARKHIPIDFLPQDIAHRTMNGKPVHIEDDGQYHYDEAK